MCYRSVAWYHDFILSKCANECRIVLWRIEGFNSEDERLSPASAPTTHEFRPTRSAFGGTYQRLLQFDAAETTPFFMRFSLFLRPEQRPVLVIGNEKSKVFFWDLQSLEEWDSADGDSDQFKLPMKPKRGVARRTGKQREPSIASSTTESSTAGLPSKSFSAVDDSSEQVSIRARQKFALDDPFKSLHPHRTLVIPRVTFAARQVAWSVGGESMVVVGDQGMMALFAR